MKKSQKLLNIYAIKNFVCVCVCMYKMVNINKREKKENNNIEALVDDIDKLWLNEKHIEEKLDHKNLPAITNKYDRVYKNHRHELLDKPKKQPNRRVLRSDLALKNNNEL